MITCSGMVPMMIAQGVLYLAVLVLAVLAIAWLVRALRAPASRGDGTAARHGQADSDTTRPADTDTEDTRWRGGCRG